MALTFFCHLCRFIRRFSGVAIGLAVSVFLLSAGVRMLRSSRAAMDKDGFPPKAVAPSSPRPGGWVHGTIEGGPPDVQVPDAVMSRLLSPTPSLPQPSEEIVLKWRRHWWKAPDGSKAPIRLQLRILPGPSIRAGSTVLNIVTFLEGELTIGDGSPGSSWQVLQENFGNFFAKIQYNPAYERVGFFLPVELARDDVGSALYGVIHVGCRVRGLDLTCEEGGSLWSLPAQQKLGAQGLSIEALLRPYGDPLTPPLGEVLRMITVRTKVSPAPLRTRGPALTRLTTPSPFVDCEDLGALEVTYTDGWAFLPDGRGAHFQLYLKAVPGPSLQLLEVPDRPVVNTLQDVRGWLLWGNGDRLYWVRQENDKELLAKATWTPADQRLWLFLPVRLISGDERPFYGVLSLYCNLRAMTCTNLTFMVTDHQARHDRILGWTFDAVFPATSSLPSPEAIEGLTYLDVEPAAPGCTQSCANCAENGCGQEVCDPSCRGSELCPDQSGSTGCCYGAWVCGCRSCGGGGGGGVEGVAVFSRLVSRSYPPTLGSLNSFAVSPHIG